QEPDVAGAGIAPLHLRGLAARRAGHGRSAVVVNELRELLHENVATPPAERGDLAAVLAGGRRRVRRRRLTAVAGTAVASAAVVGLSTVAWPGPPDLGAAGVPRPDAPTLRLTDARVAVEGDDYRVLASHTNDNLNQDNG